ncbi:junctional cadherin 5-associated protein [Sciurus carolinensis]|uniref:junctional cadherin 5-associated protein n=1 Tax=Sciurus carolinensis TaxID=30640 RepID=UPI001FB32DD1|nr:junctional cadherin 5-associated protein [Sciurus carolinensis]
MYSVEDLLISHGYKPSREPCEDNPEGRQRTRTRSRTARGLLNGYEDGPVAFEHSKSSLGTGRVSDSESRRGTPRGHGERQSTSASRAAEAGFYNRPTLAWSSQPQIGNNQAYWRRGGQEVSSLLGPRDQQDLEVRGMAQAHSMPIHVREGSWEVGGRTEDVMKKAVWEEELRMSGPAKWQNVSLESWNQPRKLGKQMSDGDGEKLFQELYPFIQGEHALTPQNKKKSRSLPRGLSPESLSCMEIPVPLNDGHLPDIPTTSLYPPNCTPHLESTRNPEKGGSKAPFPRPKFGRPLKPPSYGSHQQTRGENSVFQGSQQTDPHSSYSTKTSDSRHELSGSDSGLEPPVYVPPPSYRSPPQHIPNPYLEDTAPKHVSGGHSQQQHLTEKPGVGSCPRPSGVLATGNEYGMSPGSPRGFPQYPSPITAYEGSVQYIPFDDPRIRHLKLAHPMGFCEEMKLDDRTYNSAPITAQEPAHRKTQCDGALLNAQGPTPLSENERSLAFADPSPRWLRGQHPAGGGDGSFPDQRVHSVMREQWTGVRGSQHGPEEGQVSSPDPQGESTWEIQTELRKFETGIQTKKTSKKKTNETIFCLVSIPVKSESHLPDIDTNNNDLKQSADKKHRVDKSAALQEQSLLSTSSTDLELQALTGSMAGRTEFTKQDLGDPEEDKQTNDLRFIHLAKHREFKYSGSWPGHQYRDQQTQTSFSEEPQRSQLLPDENLGGTSNIASAPKSLDPPASKSHMNTPFVSGVQKQKPDAHDLKGQMPLSPSSNSAFSRTSSSVNQAPVPKAGQSQPCLVDHGHGAHPVPKPEVVKGEPTAGPCNSRQPFGQFLLKPVSRRPWDLISQLESFNKELQEEEESRNSSSEEGETEQQQEDCADSRPRNQGFYENSQQHPRVLVPEDPGFQLGRVKSRLENWSEEPKPGHPCAHPQFPGSLQVEDSRLDPYHLADGSLITKKQSHEVVNGINELPVSPGPVKRMMSSRPSDSKLAPLSYLAEPKEPPESLKLTNALSSVQLNKGVPPKNDGEEKGTVIPLSLSVKNRGLSAPDLRSVGLTMGQEQSVSKLDRSLGKERAIEIPQDESLQARAERILGIEVAVESLLPGTRAGHRQPPKPDASACSPESPREKSLPSSVPSDAPLVTADAFYGRRKCGWTESPLFVGERAPQTSELLNVDRVLTSQPTCPEPQPNHLESKFFEPKDVEAKPPFRSTLFHFIERTPNVAASEKRLRSPSKAIESLQEKLASPQRRADPDRLMRMKEVSSVSRMRCLSFRSTDSTEEAEELKVPRNQAWQPGGPVSLSSGDQAWRVGHLSSASKDVISQEENGHLAAQREKNMDQGFWCPDSYDPSRVERV